jgi:hypothetical protein
MKNILVLFMFILILNSCKEVFYFYRSKHIQEYTNSQIINKNIITYKNGSIILNNEKFNVKKIRKPYETIYINNLQFISINSNDTFLMNDVVYAPIADVRFAGELNGISRISGYCIQKEDTSLSIWGKNVNCFHFNTNVSLVWDLDLTMFIINNEAFQPTVDYFIDVNSLHIVALKIRKKQDFLYNSSQWILFQNY